MLKKHAVIEKQTDQVLIDYVSLFKNEKNIHLHKYAFLPKGTDWYSKLQNHPEYYLTSQEQELIKSISSANQNHSKLSSYKINHIFEIGPGTEKSLKTKTIPFLKVLKPQLYTAIDTCPKYASDAVNCVKASSGMPSGILCQDAFQGLDFKHTKEKKGILILGSTIGNLYPKEFHAFFTNLAMSLKDNDFFIVSFDSNKDEKKLKKAYFNECAGGLALNVMRYFKQYTGLKDFDSEAFDFKPVWNKNLDAIEFRLVANKPQKFSLKQEQLTIKTGNQYNVFMSKKFYLSEIAFLMEFYGFHLVDAFQAPKNPFIIAAFSKKTSS